jgi:hypothetical protein
MIAQEPSGGESNPHQQRVDADVVYDGELDLLLPQSVTRPLWRSLATSLRDRLSPEKFPPLQITSRPVDVGMLIGDIVSLPWYRTVFTNLGNVIAPETLPPLELESRPVEVGELISDQMAHLWWTSLLRNLADRVAPERLPPLQLTSVPVMSDARPGPMQLVRWSSLITLPKRTPLERARTNATTMTSGAVPAATRPIASGMQPLATSILAAPIPAHVHGKKLKTKLSRSRLREGLLIAVASLEAIYLLASFLGLV